MIVLNLTEIEMEGLRSIFSVVDMSKINEQSLAGIASVMNKVYQYELGGPSYTIKND